MSKLTRENLYSLEKYAEIRPQFRARVIEHKKNRRLAVGEHLALYFEDALTMQYQVQEMLRIERIFEAHGIQEELDVYNPLIPDGMNWKATFMVEYEDADERRRALARLIGVEKALWIRVEGFDKVHPIANEDLERETPDKTASVHFLRFELNPEMVAAAKRGATLKAGCDHPNCTEEVTVPEAVRAALVGDLQ